MQSQSVPAITAQSFKGKMVKIGPITTSPETLEGAECQGTSRVNRRECSDAASRMSHTQTPTIPALLREGSKTGGHHGGRGTSR
jgi:hypothetical protein